MKAKDFQALTAQRILEIFRDEHQNRVLLADEVGLGKTIIANVVIKKVAKWHRDELHDDHFKVIYVCSNINIANQNYHKLGVPEDDCLNITESRLSMLHLRIFQKAKKDHNYLQLIPLTPATSFTMTGGQGMSSERALIYLFLIRYKKLAIYPNSLNDLLRFKEIMTSWDITKKWYQNLITKCDADHGAYIETMMTYLNERISEDLYQRLLKVCQTEDIFTVSYAQRRDLIVELRKIFAQISLDELKPDLVIMDEFQRFKDLITPKDDESSMLSKKFLSSPEIKVLLLSATPYKPYSTIEELSTGEADHYKEFNDVMNFLLYTSQKKEYFHEVWKNYSLLLSKLKTDNLTILIAQKKHAEEALYQSVCRTERMNNAMIDTRKAKTVSISAEDILSYVEIQNLMNSLALGNFPIDYVKSSPYLLSFMMNYQVNEKISSTLKKLKDYTQVINSKSLLIRKRQINNYQPIPCNNARLQVLFDEVFNKDKEGPEMLLWVPASLPYYQTSGLFHRNSGFSKLLVFSSWEMVPRMIAVLTSYEAERRTIGQLPSQGDGKVKKYFAEDNKKRSVTIRLKDETENLIKYASTYLASLYVPLDYHDQSLTKIRKLVTQILQIRIDEISKEYKLKNSKGGASQLLELLKVLDGKTSELKLEVITSNAAETLANMAIGSPAVCAYRLFHNENFASELADSFVSLFNKQESVSILDIMYKKDPEDYYENVFKYCTEGNLQAVLDEYAYVLGNDKEQLLKSMKAGFIDTVPIQIKTQESFQEGKAHVRVRTHFATGYFNAQINEKSVQRTENIRTAFNSPFRPFVLATTSIGQEGLDFHSYSRKIMHWNLPSNPVDLEQREGRINRYLCHAIRQNIAVSRFGKEEFKLDAWNEMFENASLELKGDNSDLVPFWCLPVGFAIPMKIERIVPMYPFSQDKLRYDRLIKVLSLYRLTLGQPRQEDLLLALGKQKLDDTQLNDLYINLSPFTRKP